MNEHDRKLSRIVTAVLSLAIFGAPFVALLYGFAPALCVMAAGLGAASYLLRIAVSDSPLSTRRWLRVAIMVNIVLAGACLLAASGIWLAGER